MNNSDALKAAETFIAQARFDKAAGIYENLLKDYYGHADFHHVFGLVLMELGRLPEALRHVMKANAIEPQNPLYLKSIGDLHQELNDHDAALEYYQKGLTLAPGDNDLMLNLANTLEQKNEFEQALSCYHRIIERTPGYYRAHLNIGKTYYDQGYIDEAIKWYDRSIALAPDYAEAHFNKSVALLGKGDFKNGWLEYEWRFKRRQANQIYPHQLKGKRWDGGPYGGERLLVHCEQGMGDVLQFCRYLPMVKALGGTLLMEVHAPLASLLRRMPAIDEILVFDSLKPTDTAYSRYVPLLSLPFLFNTRLDTIPRHIPYLAADPEKNRWWRHKIGQHGLRVGLVWSAGVTGRMRSCEFRDLSVLLTVPGIRYFSLQKGEAAKQMESIDAAHQVVPLGHDLHDFDDTAAAIANLDIIVSVDTAVAHLAGAMGKPFWLLLPAAADWRWSHGKPTNPWYPTARLFHQQQRGDWKNAVERVAQILSKQMASHATNGHALEHPSAGIDDETIRTLYDQGTALCDAGEFKAAIPVLQQVIAAAPQWADAHFVLATAYHALDQHPQAIQSYHAAVRIDPGMEAAHTNLGLAYQQSGDLSQAAACYEKVISLHRDLAGIFTNLGVVQERRSNLPAAVESYQCALRIDPDAADAHYNLGNIHLNASELDKAIACYRRALDSRPDHVKATGNLGYALHRCGLIEEAMVQYDRAIEMNPEYAQARFNRSIASLLVGDWARGWPDYEWRFLCHDWQKTYPHKLYGERWDGRPFADKTILVHSEQGIGDALQFSRYLPMVKARGGRVIFEVRRSLLRLLKSLDGVDEFIELSTDKPPSRHYNYYIALCSLPFIFDTLPGNVPNKVPYLRAEPDKIDRFRRRLPSQGLNVGLVWGGNDTYKERSLSLETLSPLAFIKGINWIGLQKGSASHQTESQNLPHYFHVTNWGERFEDFSDTAAAVECLDLIITIDTSVAHLAGALGKPVWVLLPTVPDWRWMLERSQTPWYPDMRLYRQSRSLGWRHAINHVCAALERWRNEHAAPK